MEKGKKDYDDFNVVLQLAFMFVNLYNVSSFVKSVIGLAFPLESPFDDTVYGPSQGQYLWQMLFSVLSIVFLILISRLKKWAVYSYFALIAVNALVLYLFTGQLDAIVYGAVCCVVLRLLLMLRKNGRSAWELLCNNKNENRG